MCRAWSFFAEASNSEALRFRSWGATLGENSGKLLSFLLSPILAWIFSSLAPCNIPCVMLLSVIIFMISKRNLLFVTKVCLNHLRFKEKMAIIENSFHINGLEIKPKDILCAHTHKCT
uniref:Uncharacterized protein n=1 Tax=Mus musculus TaxID=10090 RepID=Q9D3A4_MOUSE|nr:unnamed protein product [Mus musculus]